jgi:MarR family transcriptional regulator, organic hydroperoxide resistance regulator
VWKIKRSILLNMNDASKLIQISILWMHLDEAAFLISTARERELKKYNLSSVQMKVLLILNYLDHALTINEMCRWLVRGHTSVSLITDKMESKGLVKKYPDANNKNKTRLLITDKGKQTIFQLIPRKPIPDILSILTEDERDLLISYLKKIIHQSIKVTSPEYPPQLDELSMMLTMGINKTT